MLFNPLRYGIFSFQLFMHKLMRYMVPLFLLPGAISLTALAAFGSYHPLLLPATGIVVGTIFLGRRSRPQRSNLIIRACHLLYYYLKVNYALGLAWINVLKGTRMVLWGAGRKGM